MLRVTTALNAARRRAATPTQKLAALIREFEVTTARQCAKAPATFPAEHVHTIGIDEAGQGAVAGPFVAAAVYLSPNVFVPSLADSKTLSTEERDAVSDALWLHAGVEISVVCASAAVINEVGPGAAFTNSLAKAFFDVLPRVEGRIEAERGAKHGPLQHRDARATKYRVKHAATEPVLAGIFDGAAVPPAVLNQRHAHYSATALARADTSCPSVAAASIIAKSLRDRIMNDIHAEFPQFGFADNKGYPRADLTEATRQHGFTEEHRLSGELLRLIEGDFDAAGRKRRAVLQRRMKQQQAFSQAFLAASRPAPGSAAAARALRDSERVLSSF